MVDPRDPEPSSQGLEVADFRKPTDIYAIVRYFGTDIAYAEMLCRDGEWRQHDWTHAVLSERPIARARAKRLVGTMGGRTVTLWTVSDKARAENEIACVKERRYECFIEDHESLPWTPGRCADYAGRGLHLMRCKRQDGHGLAGLFCRQHAKWHPALAPDPRDPDPSRSGIFRDHNCWKYKDGAELLRCPTPKTPGNCGYPHARND
jgi:hypothetical protein